MHLQHIAPTNLSSAHKVVLGCICSELGQSGQTATIQSIAAALALDFATAVAVRNDLLPAQLAQTVERALGRATQQLTSRGVRADHVSNLIEKVRRELSSALQTARDAPIY